MNNSPWLKINKAVCTNAGVWSAAPEKTFEYSDGHTAEQALAEILSRAQDRSSLSVELDRVAHDWVSRYHLGSERANIYRFLRLKGLENGLELGCGCGAIARYIGEQGIQLDAVEGNYTRAELAAKRCADLENVTVIHENFNHAKIPEKSYDIVLLNGVLEYAGKFIAGGGGNSKEAASKILARATAALVPGGVLCLAIENRMGLKYWLGAAEDHYGIPYLGLYNYPAETGIRTYDRQELESILGNRCCRFFFPFPDYKTARLVLSEEYIEDNPDCAAHLYRMPSLDNDVPVESDVNEFFAWQGLRQADKLADFANSFFILISDDPESLAAIAPYDFAHFAGRNRKPAYRVMTRKRRGQELVEKIGMFPRQGALSPVLEQRLEAAEFVRGPLLASIWLTACLGRDFNALKQHLISYFQFLVEFFENDRKDLAFDLLPFNIIVSDNGSFQFIDREWCYHADLTPEYILFRALLWFPDGNNTLLYPFFEKFHLATIQDVIAFGFDAVSRTLTEEKLEHFIMLEEQFQSLVEFQSGANPVRYLLNRPLARGVSGQGQEVFLAQLYWQDEGAFNEDATVVCQGRIGVDRQQLVFRLPPGLKPPERIRLDPADRPGFFHLYQIAIQEEHKTGDRNELFRLHDSQQIADASDLGNLYYCKNILGEAFYASGNDPFLEITIPPEIVEQYRGGILIVEVEMDWPQSPDYLVVMDSLGHEVVRKQELLKQKDEHITQLERHNATQADRIFSQIETIRELKDNLAARDRYYQEKLATRERHLGDQISAKDVHIANLEGELARIRQTRAWRAAEFFRRTIYYRAGSILLLGKKSVQTLRNEGLRSFLRKSKRTLQENRQVVTLGLLKSDYDRWIREHALDHNAREQILQEIEGFSSKPCISIIVPVYNVDRIWLEKTIVSVQNQLYENWELCLVDDASPAPHIREVLTSYAEADKRIKILLKEENEGIALCSNRALELATGDYVGLLDHDDELSIDALFENVKVINKYPEVGLIYSDEDKMDMEGRRVDPFFKPDYSPDLLLSQNYICHFTVMRKSIVDEIGGFRKGYDGSQDHDIILRVVEKAERVCHIPKILYHWRKIPGSTAAVYDSKSYAWEAGRLAIEDSLLRRKIEGTVSLAKYQGSYRVTRTIIGRPLVSIIIPFKDKPELLATCLDSILDKTDYQEFEIIGISNNSRQQETFSLMAAYAEKDVRIRFVKHDIPFNFPKLCNFGVDEARGEYVLLLNNDIEILAGGWLESLLEHAQRQEVGAVGGKLYYPDDRIQHAGIVVGMVGAAGHPHRFFHRDDVGYYARAHVIHNVSAVTGACLMVQKSKYLEVEGMDEENFPVAYNDIDFCLRLLEKGYWNVFTPYCEVCHHESLTRGYEDTPEKQDRLARETEAFMQVWDDFIQRGDPWYNPNLALDREDFSLRLTSSRELVGSLQVKGRTS